MGRITMIFLIFFGIVVFPFSVDDLFTLHVEDLKSDEQLFFETHQSGRYIYLNYRIYKNGEHQEDRIEVIDLEKEKLIYRDTGKDMRPFTMEGDFLFYSVNDSVLNVVNVKTNEKKEISLDTKFSPGWSLVPSKGKFLVFREDGLEVYKLDGSKITTLKYPDFIEPYPILVVENEVFYHTNRDLEYGVFNYETGKSFRITYGLGRMIYIPHINYYTKEGTALKKFPIPVMIEENRKWKFALMDSKGKFIFLKGFESSEDSDLFWVEDDTGDRFIMRINRGNVMVVDRKGKLVLVIPHSSYNVLDAKLTEDGKILVTTAGSGREKSKFILYDENGNKMMEKVTDPFSHDPFILTVSQEEVLLGEDNDFVKISLKDGKITGLYIFPIKYVVNFAGFYKKKVFVLKEPRYRDVGTSVDLLSFLFSSRGWFNASITLKPTTGKPLEVYNDMDVEVKIKAESCFEEKGISISVDRGNLKTEKTYYGDVHVWHTPVKEGTAKITLSLGILSKEFPVNIKKLENPIVVESIEKRPSPLPNEPFVFYVEGYIRNESNVSFKNLEWNLQSENSEILESCFPDSIDEHGKRDFWIKMKFDTSRMKVSWNGYEITAKLKISLNYKRGSLEKFVEETFKVEPTYRFTVKLVDKRTSRSVKPDLKYFSIYDESGVEIENVSKTVEGNVIKVSGIARGFSEAPLVLTLKYMKFQKRIEITKPNLSYTMELNFTSSIRVLAKENGKPKKGVSISLVKLDEPDKSWRRTTRGDGICVFDGLEKGNYKVVFSKTKYIPVEKTVSLDIGDLKEVELDIKPYRAFLVYIESYYKNALSDKLDVKFKGARNLIKVKNTDSVYIIPENTDKIYFNMLYKLGYPEGVISSIFSEKSYDAVVEVLKREYEFIAYLSKYQGKKIVTFKESDIYKPGEDLEEKLGDPFNVSEIKKPKKLVIEATASAGDNEKAKKITIWLFPSNWIGYEREAKQIVILYPLKDNIDALDYGDDAKDYLSNVQGELTSLALNKIVWYGAESLEIFEDKAGWKDSPFRSFLESKSKNFVKEKLLKVVGKLAGELAKGVVEEYLDIFDTLKNAKEWGERIYEVTDEGVALVYAGSLLENMASQDSNFNTVVKMEKILKKKLSLLISKVEENDPEGVRQIMNDIKILTVGPNPQSENIEDHRIDYSRYGFGNRFGYTLAVLCGLEYNNIKKWEGNDYPNYFGDYTISYSVEDKINASHEAMKIYKPIFKNLIMLSVPFVYASLIE
ncbi:MAG: hypothetical protein DRP24_04675 [Thermotoga sp.]|nr:MAG: hypothetical protein DRP24_04675 [Thermotoga sp.]